MYTTDGVKLSDKCGNNCALSNRFDNVMDLYDAIEDSESAEQLSHEVSEVSRYGVWNVDRDTKAYTRLAHRDPLGNIDYLIVKKA